VDKSGFVAIGKVVGAHGLKGAVKVYPYSESTAALESGNPILVSDSRGNERFCTVNRVNPGGRVRLVFFDDISDRNLAEALVGSELYFEKARLPDPEDGSFYWFDLIGMSVYTIDDEFLGRLESILETGSNDVYVVKHGDDEILIPALESVVRKIDIKNKLMRVDLPEGLL